MKNIKSFIFTDGATILFYELLDSFHKSFSDVVLMSGLAKNGDKINDIFFENNIYFPERFYHKLLEGFSNYKPSVRCQAIRKNRLEMECLYYDFGEFDNINHVYLIKNTMDWTNKNTFNCEVWNLLQVDIDQIQYHWHQIENEYI